jgi:AcrR family transcriptional regulator
MATGTLPPTGLARRERRLSDQETERRMLGAALAVVSRTGLTVSLDHLSFEDIIRDADVSRSAVYRRWPYKDLFFSDLVKQLALDAAPGVVADELQLMKQIAAARADWLETPELRRRLLPEIFRQLSLLNYQAISDSSGWRTYIALHATFLSLADGTLRDQVRAALSACELARNGRLAQAWRQLTALLGYRLRPGSGITFEVLATLLTATMRGTVLMTLSAPDVAEGRVEASPFGAAETAEWSLPALGLAGLALACLEPDPEIKWDAERIASARRAVAEWAVPEA